VFRRLLNVLRPNRLDADILEELEFHRTQTRGSFGNIMRIREQTRDASTVVWLESLMQDIRYGFRQLRRTPSLSAVDYFSVLGLTPAAGRFLVTGEDEPGAPDYAVISYGYWRRQFGMDSAVIGKAIERNGDPVTIIGIASPEFSGILIGSPVDMWTTLNRVSTNVRSSPGMGFLQLLGRRRPGVTERQAQTEADGLLKRHLLDYASEKPGWTAREKQLVLSSRIVLEPGATGLSSLRVQYSESLQLPFAITGLVLLVACANIANLLLARGAARSKEIAMRLAIGASRGRIIRQLITEGLRLAGFGGALALWITYSGAAFLVALMSGGRGDGPLTLDTSPDWRVLLFCAAVSFVVGLLFGVAPALRSVRGAGMNERGDIGDARRLGVGKILISFQVALTVVLVIAPGLFLRTLLNLRSAPLGYDVERLYKIDFSFRRGFSDESKPALFAQLPDRLAETPGVLSATLISPWGGGFTNNVSIPSYSATEKLEVNPYRTAPGFFALMRIPLQAGRDFTRQDTAGSTRVTIINQIMAKQYFRGRNPIGQMIQFPRDNTPSAIVGVVGDTRVEGLRRDPPPIAYSPLAQARELPAGAPVALVRLAGPPPDLAQAVKAINPGIKFESGILVKETIDNQLIQERMLALLSSFFGGLTLLLACIGLYGLLSYVLARRTSEIGVRLALGARPSQVVTMVLRESAVMVALGLVVGIGAALGMARLVGPFLFGLHPTDPSTIVIAVATLSSVAFAAAFLPARRASRLDPVNALRRE
jgi:predicted permease